MNDGAFVHTVLPGQSLSEVIDAAASGDTIVCPSRMYQVHAVCIAGRLRTASARPRTARSPTAHAHVCGVHTHEGIV